jgi:hypothetical protein
LVAASINADPVYDFVTIENCDWEAVPIFECYDCGKEIGEKEGYLCGNGHICDDCVCELQVSEKPSAHVVNIMPYDAIAIDDEIVYCSSYKTAKERLLSITPKVNSVTQELKGSFIVSQNNGEFWYMLNEIMNEPTTFKLYVFAPKDAVAKKYLRRMLEDCVYSWCYLENPEDYQCQDDDCATEEDIAKFYEEQNREQEALEAQEEQEDYDSYYTNKALCVACGEINYAEPICESEGCSRMVCCDCIEIGHSCAECNIFTMDNLYDGSCFDCKFKNHVLTKQQKPLWAHLLTIVDIQRLTKEHFNVLADYAALCEFTIFDAYRYKSRCHYYDCNTLVEPSRWNAEMTTQFCCKRHCEYAEDMGCHCYEVYNDIDYDGDYEEAICKVCNSNHEQNVDTHLAFVNSYKHDGPIVSAICMCEELCMSNVLEESLVDLYEYFV